MLQTLTAFLMIAAAVILGADRRIVRALRERQAQSPGSATLLPPRGAISRWRLTRLLEHGAVVRVGDTDRLYLAEPAWQAYRSSRRRRVLLVLAIAIPLFLLFTWVASSSGWFATDL